MFTKNIINKDQVKPEITQEIKNALFFFKYNKYLKMSHQSTKNSFNVKNIKTMNG